MLSQRQKLIYNFIKEFKINNQYSPSVREIGKQLGIKSTSTVHNDIAKLEELGYIKRNLNKSRSIEICEDDFTQPSTKSASKEDTIDVPIVGNVAAGIPITAVEDHDEMFPIPSYYSNKGNLFMLRVKGDSMIEVGILDGDMVLVRKQNTCENGDIVVALIDDSATVKTFMKEQGIIKLIPENSSMDPIIPDQCEILGKVISLYREHI